MGRSIENLSGNIDWGDLLLLLMLGVFGLFTLLSIAPSFFYQQLLYILAALVIMAFISRVDGVVLSWFAPFGYCLAVILLVASYFGPAIRGATRWIFIFGVQLQPSELIKPLLLLAFSWAMVKYPPKKISTVLFHVVGFLVPFLLVFKQPDLGSSVVYGLFWIAMMIGSGFPVRIFAVLSVLGGLALPALWRRLADFQQARILTFLNPGLDPKGAGYNALQAMIAVGSGQLFGRGLGRGTQSHLRFLPEFHTDFIFATLVEELGFLGGLLLLLVYAGLLWRIIVPLVRGVVNDMFPFVFSIGFFTMLTSQIFINTGMNMGIIPITGITLPFVSYGGSSILSVAVSFGFLWSIRKARFMVQ